MARTPASHDAPLAARTLAQLAAVTLIWGSTWTVIRTQLGVVPIAWSVAYRFATAALLLLAYCLLARRSLRIGRRGHLFALLVGLFQFVLNFNLVYRAEQYVTSGVVAVIFALLVVPNALFAWIFLKHPATPRFLLGSALGIAGVAMLFWHELAMAKTGDGEVVLGFVLTTLAVISASLANVMQASAFARSLPSEGLLTISLIYGVLLNAIVALATAGAPAVDPSPLYVSGVLYLGVIASAVAFTFYYDAIRTIGPGRAAYSNLVVPFVAMSLSTVLEGYRWTALAIGGGALAVAGLYVALTARRST